MSGIGVNSPVAKYPVSASCRLEGFPVRGAFARPAVPRLARQAAADRGLWLSMRALDRQLTARPCHLYQIRLVHYASRRAFPGERLWRASQLAAAATVRFLRARNREGYDVYFRPYAGDYNTTPATFCWTSTGAHPPSWRVCAPRTIRRARSSKPARAICRPGFG